MLMVEIVLEFRIYTYYYMHVFKNNVFLKIDINPVQNLLSITNQ